MSYRRRHRWFRRMALGLAFATAVFAGRASVAVATLDERTSSAPVATATDPYLTDVFVRPGEGLGSADGVAQADRPEVRWTFHRGDVVTIGIGALLGIGGVVLVLGLGLALGYLRRLRLAGLS
jgi:hypothetical protein